MTSLRSCQKSPPCPTEPVLPAPGHLLLAKAEPGSDGGSTSGMMYLRGGRREWCNANYGRRNDDCGEAAVPMLSMDAHDGAAHGGAHTGEGECQNKSVTTWEASAGAGSWQGPAPDQLREEPKLEQVPW